MTGRPERAMCPKLVQSPKEMAATFSAEEAKISAERSASGGGGGRLSNDLRWKLICVYLWSSGGIGTDPYLRQVKVKRKQEVQT